MNCVPTGSALVPVYSKYALFSPPELANSGIDKALSPTEAAKEMRVVSYTTESVSYTHLTLPTILRV